MNTHQHHSTFDFDLSAFVLLTKISKYKIDNYNFLLINITYALRHLYAIWHLYANFGDTLHAFSCFGFVLFLFSIVLLMSDFMQVVQSSYEWCFWTVFSWIWGRGQWSWSVAPATGISNLSLKFHAFKSDHLLCVIPLWWTNSWCLIHFFPVGINFKGLQSRRSFSVISSYFSGWIDVILVRDVDEIDLTFK